MAAISPGGSRREPPATLVDVASHRLRGAILSGALAPGDKIVEEDLCADMGISRAPLREALRLLGEQGLVEYVPRRGSRVTSWSTGDILQLFALRHVLERHAMEMALPLAHPDARLVPVQDALQRMRDATDDLDRDDAHRAFHAAVVGLADNRQLDIALAPILLKLQVPMAMNLREEARHHRADDGIARHEAILTALRSNSHDTVISALEDHGHLHYLPLSDRPRPADC